MIEVFRATGRAIDGGPDTAFKIEAIKQAKDRARGPLGKIIDNINPAQALRNFSEWSSERNYQRQAEKVAEIFIKGDRDAIMALRQLRQFGPGDIRRRLVIGHLLGNAGEYGGSEAMDALAR
jgi:hypothetical protein